MENQKNKIKKLEENKERVAIFIDGANFHHSTKSIKKRGDKINFKEIIEKLARGREVKTLYYTALLDPNHNKDKYKKQKKILSSLKKIPNFKIILCDLKKIRINNKIKYEIKGDDINLAHDLLIGAFDNLYHTAIIISGDADFIPVINTLRNRFKKKVGNCYFRRTSSFKLRNACDFSISMNKLIRNSQKL